MKKDIRIKISNEDGSVKQNTLHEIHLDNFSYDTQVIEIAEEAIKKFKASGEEPDEVVISEVYYYG
jgi:hypothetical protein